MFRSTSWSMHFRCGSLICMHGPFTSRCLFRLLLVLEGCITYGYPKYHILDSHFQGWYLYSQKVVMSLVNMTDYKSSPVCHYCPGQNVSACPLIAGSQFKKPIASRVDELISSFTLYLLTWLFLCLPSPIASWIENYLWYGVIFLFYFIFFWDCILITFSLPPFSLQTLLHSPPHSFNFMFCPHKL